MNKQAKTIISLVITSALILPGFNSPVTFADSVGERQTFYVDKDYDAFSRTSVAATLVAVGEHSYVYVEDEVIVKYGGINSPGFLSAIAKVVSDFDETIYPTLTGLWGSEPNPGIDGDEKITILFEQLGSSVGGYTDTSNLYPIVGSNQREMISLSADTLADGRAHVFLAHEFEHLISANQKILLNSVAENVWLDELRAQYSVTAAGYNFPFNRSDLAARKRDFLNNPTDSLTEWQGKSVDYAPVTLFGHYLVEQYGVGILRDPLPSRLAGIDSIDAWLAEKRYSERFTNVFGNWAVANYLNQRSINTSYGYADPNLADIRVNPIDTQTLGHPLSQFVFSLKPWQPKWYKFFHSPLSEENIKISWTGSAVSILMLDETGSVRSLYNGEIFSPADGPFTLIPFNHPDGSSSSKSETAINVSLSLEYTSEPAVIADGSLIKRRGEPYIYVIEGKYKRYLSPEVIALYGHLDTSKAIELDPAKFDSYVSSNYVRYVNEQKVYAVWPDNTKHWLNISAQTFSETGRDWNSIFIINDLELNLYATGADITR